MTLQYQIDFNNVLCAWFNGPTDKFTAEIYGDGVHWEANIIECNDPTWPRSGAILKTKRDSFMELLSWVEEELKFRESHERN